MRLNIVKELQKGKNKSKTEKRASETAMFAAIHRFVATKEENPAFQGPDLLSRIFLPPVARFFLSFKYMRNNIRKKLRKQVPGTYEYVTARTRHFDLIYKQALEENIPQIVLLGAGYDTRPIRYKDMIKETAIFELDAPVIQRQKKEILYKSKISVPEQVTLMPINFNLEKVEDVLKTAGYNTAVKSCFLWEGVTYYLTEETVKDTLSAINIYSGVGSTVSFDYFYRSAIDGSSEYYGANEICREVLKSDEPFQFGLNSEEIEGFLSECGFDVVDHYSPEEFEKKYLYDEKGEFYGKMYGFACNVTAKVKP
jgi:methyltransferase (TIGR00027 family)